MNQSEVLAGRFREVMLNGTWIANTNYHHQLQGLELPTATAKVGDLNTISVLAQHIHYYIAGIKQVFLGGSLDIRDRFSFDFPAMETQAQWDAFLEKFWKDCEEFAQWVAQMPDAQLEAAFVDEKYGSYGRNIDGMIEHAYYHLGQISLIKKMLLNAKTP